MSFVSLIHYSISVSVGEAFIHLPTERVTNFLEEEKKKIKESLGDTNEEIEKLSKEMLILKEQLYAKFKDNINLEETDE